MTQKHTDSDTAPVEDREEPTAFAGLAGLSEAARVRLAAAARLPPEALSQLAADKAVMVRATLAMNPTAMHATTPPDVLHQVAKDPDDRVRALLAQRLAHALPNMPTTQREALQDQAVSTLFLLVEDAAVRVRAAIADVVKDLPDVPHALILQLAQDVAVCVCDPVIQLSPLLTTDDLLTLVDEAPGPSTVIAVARRPGLAAQVADAIAAGSDSLAITALISNPSASISEATLDFLVARAADQVEWHQPLIHRPALSGRSMQALAGFVSDQLLAELARRADLPGHVAREIGQKLLVHMAARTRHVVAKGTVASDHFDPDDPCVRAMAMADAGALTEAALIRVAQSGDVGLCVAMLAVAARVPPAVVERARALRSAKGLVSLTWQAGFSMRAATPLQTLLGRLAPDMLMMPNAGGGFPLTDDEMRWQVSFLTRIGRQGEQSV